MSGRRARKIRKALEKNIDKVYGDFFSYVKYVRFFKRIGLCLKIMFVKYEKRIK